MSLKKIALIALIVVMLVSTILFFGCKPKVQEEPVDTTMVESVEEVVVDTLNNATTTTTTTETKTTP